MAENVQVCGVGDELKAKLKKFRFRKEKTIAALVLKVDASNLQVDLEEEYEETTIEELQTELPERHPRFVVLSYKLDHDDGRVSYPLCYIYICPAGCKPEMAMMYAGAKNFVQKELGLTKVFELRDVDDFTEDWLIDKLKFFR